MLQIVVRGASARRCGALDRRSQCFRSPDCRDASDCRSWRFRSLFATFQKPRSPRRFRSSFAALQLAGDASSFCSWRCFIGDTSSVTLHPLSVRRCFIDDASSSVRSATLHPLQLATLLTTLQFATLRYIYIYIFFFFFLLS